MSASPGSEPFIVFDGRQLSVTTDVPEARWFLEDAFRHMIVPEVSESAGEFSFIASPEGFVLASAERFDYGGVPVEQSFPLVKDEVSLHFMRSRPPCPELAATREAKYLRV